MSLFSGAISLVKIKREIIYEDSEFFDSRALRHQKTFPPPNLKKLKQDIRAKLDKHHIFDEENGNWMPKRINLKNKKKN